MYNALYRAEEKHRSLFQGPSQNRPVFDEQENIHRQKELYRTNTKDRSPGAYPLEHAKRPKQKNAEQL